MFQSGELCHQRGETSASVHPTGADGSLAAIDGYKTAGDLQVIDYTLLFERRDAGPVGPHAAVDSRRG
jgi:hypothetical protein